MPQIKLKALINEILSELEYERFPTMKGSCIPPEQFIKILRTELERFRNKEKNKEKRPLENPMVTKSQIYKTMGVKPPKGKDPEPDIEGKEINIEDFIRQLTTPPKTIFDVGEKSKHSETEYSETVNTGIPAFRGIVWDSKKKEFFLLNTCPGAGKCVVPCYALDGYYRFNDSKVTKLAQRLQLLIDNPDEYEETALHELKKFAASANAVDKILYIRWNDAGDFFDDEYMNIAIRVTNKLKQKGYNVQSYAYTKVASAYNKGEENGIIMNFSSGSNTAEKLKVKDKIRNMKFSEIVPWDLHKQFFYTKGPHIVGKDGAKRESGEKPAFKADENGSVEASRIGLKKAIYEKYKDDPEIGGFTFESLKYTDELPQQQGEKNQYNIITLPYGDSDMGSQRRDVRITFLCEH